MSEIRRFVGAMNAESENREGSKPEEGRWRRIVSSSESKVLLAGVALFVVYMTAMGLTRLRSPELFRTLWRMTLTHVLTGRAGGMSLGLQSDLNWWIVVGANMVIETFMVLLFFPLFVFSYNRLIVIKPLEETLSRAHRAAEAHQATVVKWGVPGLLLFVWFPFWMTGPVVGCIIGFLIGLRTWVNVSVVLAGTGLAIVCWGIFLQRMYNWLERLGHYIPALVMGCILLVAISIHIRYAFAKPAPGAENGE